jgi:replicative DNA helicase
MAGLIMEATRHPAPHNIEAEQALLGAVLINNDAMGVVDRLIDPADFFEPVHQQIYDSARSLIRAGRLASPVTLNAFLPADTDIAGMTPSKYLARLCAEATTVINAPDYARTIRDLAHRRALMSIGADLHGVSAEAPLEFSPDEILQQAVERIDEIAAARSETHSARVSIGGATHQSVERMTAAMQNRGRLPGITWGFRDLDAKTGGLRRGNLIIAAGRPGMGKSALAASTARRVAEAGHTVEFFSLEMPATDLADRMLTDICFDRNRPIAYFDVGCGAVSDADAERVVNAQRALREMAENLHIDPQDGLSVAQIGARVRRRKQDLERRGRRLDLVIVDHLHRIRASNRYAGNRTGEVTEISGSLKVLAKELDVPVLVLAQLSRQVEARDNKVPTLSDLRDSGAIEQDADLIAFVYREAYYLERSVCHDQAAEQTRVARLMECQYRLDVILSKNRNGPIGQVSLFFHPAANAIRDLAREPERAAA